MLKINNKKYTGFWAGALGLIITIVTLVFTFGILIVTFGLLLFPLWLPLVIGLLIGKTF